MIIIFWILYLVPTLFTYSLSAFEPKNHPMRRFIVERDAIHGRSASISGNDARHIRNVLRMKPGDSIRLLDGTGHEYEAVITGFTPGNVHVSLGDKIRSDNESPLNLIVAQALLKEGKMDGVVRQLTELGVSRFIPFVSSRSVPVPHPDRFASRLERWNKIVRESIKQCRRGIPLQVDSPHSFAHALDQSNSCNMKIIFWENTSNPIPTDIELNYQKIAIFLMIGPEGGFSQAEFDTAQSHGFLGASLGPRILRAETAPVAAATIVQYLFGDIGNKRLDKEKAIA